MKFIGYILIGLGSYILAENGFGLNTWQWWSITLCYILGQEVIAISD